MEKPMQVLDKELQNAAKNPISTGAGVATKVGLGAASGGLSGVLTPGLEDVAGVYTKKLTQGLGGNAIQSTKLENAYLNSGLHEKLQNSTFNLTSIFPKKGGINISNPIISPIQQPQPIPATVGASGNGGTGSVTLRRKYTFDLEKY